MTPDEIDDWLGSVYTRTVNCDFREQQEVIDVLNYGTTWKRYYLEDDEIKVKRIDPLDWCSWQRVGNDRFERYEPAPGGSFELGNERWWPPENERRFVIVGGQRVGRSYRIEQLREMMTDPSPPYALYRDPQTRLTRVAAAVKIALDGSVN